MAAWRCICSIKTIYLQVENILGTVGEPINEEAWEWYYTIVVGERKMPCMSLTHGGKLKLEVIMISRRLAHITTPLKPRLCQFKPSSRSTIEPQVVDDRVEMK